MYFTKEDFKKIEEWLRTHSIKESEFDNIDIIRDNEYITAVQNGINKRICLKDFIKAIADKISSGVLNASLLYDKEYITLEEVLPLIVERVSGQIITFLNPDGYWEMWQFTGDVSQWNNIELWQNVYAIFDYEDSIRTAVSEVKATKEEISNYKENTNTIVSQYKEDFDSKTKFYDNELKKFEGKQKEHISTTTQQLSNFDNTIQTYTGKVEELNAKVDTLRNMPTNYISKESLDAFLSTLGSAMGGTWTATYNETNGRYDFSFSANASAAELIEE
jgi:prefoldin subunit 5